MITFNFVEDCPSFLVNISKGVYLVEGWGASGGGNPATSKGKGAYAAAKIRLSKTTSFYITIGGEGETSTGFSQQKFKGGCNGGGDGGIGKSDKEYSNGSGGGGATDIRLSLSINDRIFVVAGGGGDSGEDSQGNVKSGGYGGADYGGIGDHLTSFSDEASQAASLTSGTTNGVGQDGRNGMGEYGSGEGNGGGGGGYRGGYSSQNNDQYSSAGGNGGSSYISDSYFKIITMKGGNEQFNSPYGQLETGHTGNGFLRIIEIKNPTCEKNFRMPNFSFFITIVILFLFK